jgi:hypothetical protein
MKTYIFLIKRKEIEKKRNDKKTNERKNRENFRELLLEKI